MTSLDTRANLAVVYPDRARITRKGKINLEIGVHQLEIPDLPIQMNPESTRAAARGTARARLLGLQVQRHFYSETPMEQVRELEAQLEAGQDEQRALETQHTLVAGQRAQVEALMAHNQVYATALASGEMSVAAQLALFDGFRQRLEALDGEQQKIAIRKRSLERRLQQLKNQLEQLRGSRPRERYTALVELEVLQPGDLTVELVYVVSQAGWKPLYDLRLVEEDGKASLEVGYLAQVTQQSGEDWQDVELTLSTARPALAATLPELEPWYLRPFQPPIQRTKMADMAAGAAMPMALSAPPRPETRQAAEEAVVEAPVAQVDSSGAAVTYHIAGKTSIPADGAPHKVTAARYALSPEMDYVCAPKLVEAAFRRARATNDSPYTLLPGAVNLFAGDEFIGATLLKLTAPQGEIELYLGAEDRVKVERELKRREVGKTLIGGKRQVRFGYEIRLENLLPVPAKVTVHDQFPVARHEDIKVRLEAAEPKPAQQSELNLLDWEVALASKEKRSLRFDFLVEIPQGMEVVGLP